MADAGGMRKRNVKSEEPRPSTGFAANIKKFDFYQKVDEDYKVKTESGGALSMICGFVIGILIFSELRTYLRTEVVDHIVVDTMMNEKLPIGLNISFPHLRCDEVSVDTVDSAGENQINIAGGLKAIELDKDGKPAQGDRKAKAGECLPCLEAAQEGMCCNTCGELKDAYAKAGLSYYHILETSEQCREVVGCNVYGDVKVSKVAGNVHVALGKSTVRNGRHVHEFNVKDVADGFNTSHIIHRLQFGDNFGGLVESPLEGVSKIVNEGAYMFHYYIKLVPTMYIDEKDEEGTKIYSHQYSVTESNKNVLMTDQQLGGLPGVFLVYEFTPFLVQKRKKYVPFSHFITSLCAIIGGMYTISAIIDTVMNKAKNKAGSKSLAL